MSDERTRRTVTRDYCRVLTTQLNVDDIELSNPREISNAIKKLKPKKASGLSNIQNIVFKNLPKKAIVQLNYVYNSC